MDMITYAYIVWSQLKQVGKTGGMKYLAQEQEHVFVWLYVGKSALFYKLI